MSNTKKLWESKTWWFNVLVFVLAILSLPQIGGVVPPEWLPHIGYLAAIGNVVLRLVTDSPISLSGK